MPDRKTGNPAPRVHAFLAAAMASPDLLDRWRHNPSALRRTKVEMTERELEKVWRFSGLITKVRHNDIRQLIPVTFKLLDRTGISIELFANYANHLSTIKDVRNKTPVEKVQSLAGFLDGWLDRDNLVHTLIRDMFKHERAILMLRDAAAPDIDAGGLKVSNVSIPRHCGLLFYHEMTCDPLEVQRNLEDDSSSLAAISRPRSLRAYHRNKPAGGIEVVEIDEAGFVILELADGERTTADMLAVMRQAGITLSSKKLFGAIQQLVANGLLVLSNNPEAGHARGSC